MLVEHPRPRAAHAHRDHAVLRTRMVGKNKQRRNARSKLKMFSWRPNGTTASHEKASQIDDKYCRYSPRSPLLPFQVACLLELRVVPSKIQQ